MSFLKTTRQISCFMCFVIAFILVFVPADSEAQTNRVYYINHVATAPKLDGRLDDAVWQSLPEATGFYVLWENGVAEQKQTHFKMAWDDKNLYVGIKCDEPDAPEIKGIRKDGERLWEEDSVEMFMAPSEIYYFHLVVNTLGNHIGMVSKGDDHVIEEWKSKSYVGKDFWSMEACIPFETLGIEKAIKDGEKWRGNIARNLTIVTNGGKPYTSWARLGLIGFHDPENFGIFVFKQAK